LSSLSGLWCKATAKAFEACQHFDWFLFCRNTADWAAYLSSNLQIVHFFLRIRQCNVSVELCSNFCIQIKLLLSKNMSDFFKDFQYCNSFSAEKPLLGMKKIVIQKLSHMICAEYYHLVHIWESNNFVYYCRLWIQRIWDLKFGKKKAKAKFAVEEVK
jgi:hypothetical protein